MVILIVEDNSALRTLLQEEFEPHHRVLTSENGRAALTLLEKETVDLVITDHMMNGMFGMELLAQGKKVSPSTSFILVTGAGNDRQAKASLELGAEDYFAKPIDFPSLRQRVSLIAQRLFPDVRSLKERTFALETPNRSSLPSGKRS